MNEYRTGRWTAARVEAALKRLDTAPTVSWLLAINSFAALVLIPVRQHQLSRISDILSE